MILKYEVAIIDNIVIRENSEGIMIAGLKFQVMEIKELKYSMWSDSTMESKILSN